MFREALSISVSQCLCARWEIYEDDEGKDRSAQLHNGLLGGCNTNDGGLQLKSLFKVPLMKDNVHHLFSLQSLVVKDEGNAAPHHLQSASAVKHGATLTHNRHWNTERKEESLQIKSTAAANIREFADASYHKSITV